MADKRVSRVFDHSTVNQTPVMLEAIAEYVNFPTFIFSGELLLSIFCIAFFDSVSTISALRSDEIVLSIAVISAISDRVELRLSFWFCSSAVMIVMLLILFVFLSIFPNIDWLGLNATLNVSATAPSSVGMSKIR